MLAKNNLLDIDLVLKRLNLKAGNNVADLGCGNFGFFVFPLARLVGREGKVYAIDIIASALDEIKRRAKIENLAQVLTIRSNLEVVGATPLADNSLDVALLINTLHQASSSLEMLKEASRLIKVGGRLLIIDWVDEAAILGPSLERRLKKEKLLTAVEFLGFDLIEDFIPGPYHYGLIFKKK